MAFRIAPMVQEKPQPQRAPRVTNERHLAFIRTLPCVICGARPVDPAHLRATLLRIGKRPVGIEKPDDKWTTPLCREHHDEQHSMAELEFWKRYGIDPFMLSLALYAFTGDEATAEFIVNQHRQLTVFDGTPVYADRR